MARQLPWDRYEVALLLDAYLRIQEEPQKEKDILADLSKICGKEPFIWDIRSMRYSETKMA